MQDAAPDNVGPYKPRQLLATGAQSQVWVADGPDGEVALKLARTEDHRAALLREIEVHRKCGEHPHLVRMISCDADGRWLAMERISGTLVDEWASGQPVSEIVRIALQLVDVLAFLHARDVVHGDVKPSNVIVDDTGDVRLIDLGVATLAGDQIKGFRGTLGYAAPELLRNERPRPRTDAYGLGALLYTCVAGRTPFVAPDPAALTYLPLVSLPAPPSAFRPEIPSLLSQLLLALLAREPGRRPGNLSKVRDMLNRVADSKPASPILGMLSEREELRRAVVGAADGEPRVVLLYGPPGSGRRTLISEAVEYARREGLPYLKGTDPNAALRTLRQASRPSVLVMRANNAGRKLAGVVLKEGLRSLFLLHSDWPVPALVQAGAIQLTPSPLSEKDTQRLARMYAADTTLADVWWRQSLGLPVAILGHIRRWRREQSDGELDLGALPAESRKIFAALLKLGEVEVPALAGKLGLGEHALLDHCEVLFAEGLVEAAQDGAAIRAVR